MKVGITGASGYLGQFAYAGLAARGYDLCAYSRTPIAGLSHHAYTLGARPDLAGLDALIHCAFSHVPGRYRGGEGDDPAGFRRDNLDGSIALFDAARAAGLNRVIFLSSRAVYGPKPVGTPLTETTACTPDTLYGQVKLDAEQALASLTTPNFTGISLRATGIYGAPTVGAWHKWQNLFETFAMGHAIAPRIGTEVLGDDLAAALDLLLKAPAAPKIANLSDILLDQHDLLALYARHKNIAPPLPDRATTQPNIMTTAPLTALGWRPAGHAGLVRFIQDL